jgi:anti-anti-sigma factor
MTHDDPQFRLTEQRGEHGPALVAEGRLVLGHGANLDWWVPAVAAVRGHRVSVDLGRVTDIDAAGLGLLVQLARAARHAGREFSIVAASPFVRRLLRAARLDAALHLEPNDRAGVDPRATGPVPAAAWAPRGASFEARDARCR